MRHAWSYTLALLLAGRVMPASRRTFLYLSFPICQLERGIPAPRLVKIKGDEACETLPWKGA